jgi:hypothetical protein
VEYQEGKEMDVVVVEKRADRASRVVWGLIGGLHSLNNGFCHAACTWPSRGSASPFVVLGMTKMLRILRMKSQFGRKASLTFVDIWA